MQKSLEDVGTLIYSSMCCSTIEKKLRAAKLRGWSSTAASFIPGDAVSRPLGHEAADAQLRLVELRARAVKSVCSACQGVCLHCTHCDRCATRIDAVAARKDMATTAATSSPPPLPLHAASSAAATASPSPPTESPLSLQHVRKARKVRCLRCMRVYNDKSAFNRHVKTICVVRPISFEHVC